MSNQYSGQGNARGQSVHKSYIPGVGYRAATRLPKKVLRRAASEKWKPHPYEGPLTPNMVRELNELGTQLRGMERVAQPTGFKNVTYTGKPENLHALRAFLPRKGAKRPVHIIVDESVDNPEQAWTMGRMGSKRPATVLLSEFQAQSPDTIAHELAHATPRRHAHRMTFGTPNLSREEARADAAALRNRRDVIRPKGADTKSMGNDYEIAGILSQANPDAAITSQGGRGVHGGSYRQMREKLGHPVPTMNEWEKGNEEAVNRLEGVMAGKPPSFTRVKKGRLGMTGPGNTVSKASTTMSQDEARRVVEQYGLQGRLPRDLPRDERMRAYEGRYVAAGGPKGEKWDRVARGSEATNAAGQVAMGTGALGLLASRRPTTSRISTAAALGGMATAGLSGAAAHHARRKRSAYSSSPAGVASSALTRMRNYSPEG